MSTTVSYKGETLTTVSNATKTLQTEGKYLEDDITLTDVSGGGAVLTTKNITANGTYNASSDSADGYSQVTVAVPASAVDSGTKSITANGNNQDVVGYAAVNVNVPNTYSAGDEGKVVSNGALVAQTAHADVTPTTSDQTINTTLNNSLKVKGDADLVASNIKKDVEIFGVTGSYEGGGGGYDLDDIATHSFTGAGTITITNVDMPQYVFAKSGFTSFSAPNYAGKDLPAHAFRESTSLQSVSFPELNKNLGSYTFYGCSGLTSVNAPKATGLNGYTFQNCTSLALICLPGLSSNAATGALSFSGCSSLATVDFGGLTRIDASCFNNASALKTLILRRTGSVTSLNNINAFAGTPFASGGTGGHIYIPKTLYDALGTGTNDYKAASNWSTVDGYGTITWHAIEGSQYENYYADGTPIS